jgi:hypothetical protein
MQGEAPVGPGEPLLGPGEPLVGLGARFRDPAAG